MTKSLETFVLILFGLVALGMFLVLISLLISSIKNVIKLGEEKNTKKNQFALNNLKGKVTIEEMQSGLYALVQTYFGKKYYYHSRQNEWVTYRYLGFRDYEGAQDRVNYLTTLKDYLKKDNILKREYSIDIKQTTNQ